MKYADIMKIIQELERNNNRLGDGNMIDITERLDIISKQIRSDVESRKLTIDAYVSTIPNLSTTAIKGLAQVSDDMSEFLSD